jgi:hypothetical protein
MKKFKFGYILAFAVLFTAVSCEDDLPEYGNEVFQEITDPYLQILTPVIAFQAGTPS